MLNHHRWWIMPRRRPIVGRLLLGLGVGLLLIFLWRGAELLTAVGSYLVLENFPVTHNTTTYGVVLAGEFPARTLEAAQLYNEGRLDSIVLTKQVEPAAFQLLTKLGTPMPEEQGRSRQLLIALGVPDTRIIRFSGTPVASTRAEAQSVRDWWQRRATLEAGAKTPARLVIVSSATHTRRAYFVFKEVFGDTAPIFVKPSRFDDYRADQWWQNRSMLKIVALEYEKLFTRHITR